MVNLRNIKIEPTSPEVQANFVVKLNNARQGLSETPLHFFRRLKLYSMIAYPEHSFDEGHRVGETMDKFMDGFDFERPRTTEETDQLLLYLYEEPALDHVMAAELFETNYVSTQ